MMAVCGRYIELLARAGHFLASNAQHTVAYAYDHQGRMVWKQISTNAVVVSTRTLNWDDYNIIAETLAQDTATNLTYNIWGLDLDGTLQGAGGVGGLLSVVRDDETSFLTYVANGNITEYLSADGTIAAHYEYSPFGEIIVQSGDLAASVTHRFSTKPWCAVTGLSEYLFRKYSPSLGRWLSRDPIEEEDSTLAEIVNSFNSNKETETLYLALLNDSINHYDLLGLTTPCSRFKRENPEKVGTDLGGIICNNGTMHFCVWTDPGTNPGIDYCIGQHEMEHKDNTQPCKPCGFERQSFKPMTFDEVRQEECKAHKKELDCLNKEVHYRCNKLKGPEKVKCLEEFKKFIDELRCVNIPAYCGTPVPEDCQ